MKGLALAAAFVLLACARPAGDLPDIHFGRDACARCGMIISEERFAAGYVGAGRETVAYDDVGELLEAVSKEPALAAKSYVHDAHDGRWLRATEAVFVKITGLATPMGTGYAAFASAKEAQDFAGRLGKTFEGPVVTLGPG